MHQRTRHVVGDDRRLDAVAHQFRTVGARPAEGSRLVGDHRHQLALLDGTPNHAQRRAVTGGRQRGMQCVRIRAPGGPPRRQTPHRPAARHILVVNRLCFAIEPIFDLLHRLARRRRGGKRSLRPFDRPEQVDGRRTRGRHQLARLAELRGELLCAGRGARPHAERDAHGGSDTDGGCAPDDHGPDRARDLGGRPAADVDLFARQLALIDHDDRISFSRDGRQHTGRSYKVKVPGARSGSGLEAAGHGEARASRGTD